MYGHLLAYRESMEERIVQELIERVQADQSGTKVTKGPVL